MEDYTLGSLKRCIHSMSRWKGKELCEVASCCLLALHSLHSRSVTHGVIIQSNDKH